MLVLGVNREAMFRPLDELFQAWDASIDVRLGDAGCAEHLSLGDAADNVYVSQ